MSAFIVISVKDSLNWIVDGIKKCRPHNPDVITHLSIGKIKKETDLKSDGKYMYEYTTYSKHAGDRNADEVLAPTIESDTPRNLFKNQIAQFLNVCENEGEQINIFLLDNPMSEEDFEQSTWLTNEIRAVYDSHAFTNFQLVRVLFSYQIDKPTDVTRQVSKMILNEITKLNLSDSDGFLTRILYIDNQKRNGAALCLDKQGHDIMLPRMLCDLMMLLSNRNDAYNTVSAINSATRMFAVGYSECMYYHDDVFNYFNIAGERDLKEYLLKTKNDETSLDFDKNPVGLEDREARLASKYDFVDFTDNIESHSESVDKRIDDIIISLKADIIGIKEAALAIANEKDKVATDVARKARIEELKTEEITNEADVENAIPEMSSPANTERTTKCNFLASIKEFFARIFGLRQNEKQNEAVQEQGTVDPRVANINITAETDKVRTEYPDYLDRKTIYEQYQVEDAEGNLYDGPKLEDNISSYNNLLGFIKSSKFYRYLKDSHDNWIELKKTIESIESMQNERVKFSAFKEKVAELKGELKVLNQKINDFRLTEHSSSVDNLIDIEKLIEFHREGRDARIKKVIEKWNQREDKVRTLKTIDEDLKEQTKWDVYSLYYVNWDEPFDFIKDINLTSVCQHLKAISQPFVNTYTLEATRENLTSYCFYSDNPKWCKSINNNDVELHDQVQITATLSAHICSKICMFQFLQMSQELIDGLVDCYES